MFKAKKTLLIIGISIAILLLILDALLIVYAVFPQQIDYWFSDMSENNELVTGAPRWFFSQYAPHTYFDIKNNLSPTGQYSIETILRNADLYNATYIEMVRSESYQKRATFVFDDSAGQRLEIYSDAVGYYSLAEKGLELHGLKYECGRSYLLVTTGKYFYSKNNGGDILIFAPLDDEYPYIELYEITEVNGKNGVKTDSARYDATCFGSETKYVSKDEFVRLVYEKQSALRQALRGES